MHIEQADINAPDDRERIRALFEEYLYWANGQLEEHFDISFDIPPMIDEDMESLAKFAPPGGRLLLAYGEDGGLAGLACMRKIRPTVGEIKRMYVRPAYRRQGVGRALVEETVKQARAIGYNALFLDSSRFMHAAHALYEDCGFVPFEEYPESEIPPQFREHWVFKRLPLD